MRHNHTPISRLFALLSVAVLTLVALGGGSGSVRAAAPTGAIAQAQTQANNNSILVLRVYYRSIDERNSIAAEFGVESPAVDGYVQVWADQTSLDSLRARGLRVEIDQAATQQANEPVLFGHNADTFWGGYYTVEEMQFYLDAKVAAYPTLAQKVDYGDSWCKAHPGACTQPTASNGYDLYAMRITNQAIAGPKPVFWFNAGLHSRELVPPEVSIRFINWLLDNYNIDADARWLVDYHDIWVVPMSNPDGHHIAENGASTPRTQRKNANNTNGCTTWPPGGSSQFGTDLNRNFPFMWGCCGGSSGSPCNLTYRGPVVDSEEETQGITSKLRELIPDQRGPNINDPTPLLGTGVYMDMHSNAALDLYPWGQTYDPAPNDPDLKNIARHFGAVNAGGNGYTVEQSVGLYPTDGASDDWEYGELGAPGFTIELSSGGSFTPPYSTVNTDWNNNKGALLYLSRIARTPLLTTRGPDANLVAATPMTVTQGAPALLSATINYAWTNNVYLQNVAAAEYYIDTPPWAGGAPLPMSPTDGTFNSATEGAQANIDTGALTPGQHLLLVRGRGVNDYAGNQSWGPISATFIYVLPSGGATSTPTVAAASPTRTATIASTSTTIPTATSTSTTIPSQTSASTATPFTPGPTNTSGGCFDGGKIPVTCTPTPTLTSIPTSTPTRTPAVTNTATFTAISTSISTASPTACALTFTDVPADSTFYAWIRCLSCLGIINGYPDGTFRPGNNVTRGQLAKIVANSAGFIDPQSTQLFEDVAPGSTFYDYIGRLASRGYMTGYPCGGTGEPCGSGNLPYFRPNSDATRGQISKIVSNAAGFVDPPGDQLFEDVDPGDTFYDYINRLARRGYIRGYPCGGPGEPCGTGNLPYFRPGNDATRGQASKIVANTFFPDCNPPRR